MIEYYEAAFDHYFMTSLPNEIEALDAGTLPGWTRTGRSFTVYPSATLGAERVCRFFNDQIVPSSHFYSADPNECLFTQNQAGWTWQLEGIVAYIVVPDLAGNCTAATVPVYRLYNNAKGGAPNHRYTTSATVRAQMLAQGGVAEGWRWYCHVRAIALKHVTRVRFESNIVLGAVHRMSDLFDLTGTGIDDALTPSAGARRRIAHPIARQNPRAA